ncbi:unnamed protein product [Rhizopus stolonifer]
MSTKSERLADRATNEKNTKILVGLLQHPHNRTCANCRKKGIFVCIQCSGIHKSLGTHISKVKSVDLDTWVPEQIESMVQWGNQRANTYWEEKLGDQQPPEGSMEKWIRAKYEQKKWVKNEAVPDPVEIKIDESKKTIVADNQTKINQLAKDNSVELGHHFYTHGSHSNKLPNTHAPKDEKLSLKVIPTPTSSKPSSTKESQPCKFDLASFQQQLSMLAVGRPSTGLIPKAPEGSDKSWANLVIPSKVSKSLSNETH